MTSLCPPPPPPHTHTLSHPIHFSDINIPGLHASVHCSGDGQLSTNGYQAHPSTPTCPTHTFLILILLAPTAHFLDGCLSVLDVDRDNPSSPPPPPTPHHHHHTRHTAYSPFSHQHSWAPWSSWWSWRRPVECPWCWRSRRGPWRWWGHAGNSAWRSSPAGHNTQSWLSGGKQGKL